MPMLEFKIPDDSAPKNDKGEVIKTTEAVTISYSGITGSTTNDKLKNLPRYIKWISGSMTCTASKSAGAGTMPLSMKIGDGNSAITVYNNVDGIPFSGSTTNKVNIYPPDTTIKDDKGVKIPEELIKLSGEGNYSVATLYWIFGEKSTWPKYYSYTNTGLTINYENPIYTIQGLSNNPEWGEITGTGDFEIIEKEKTLTQTITAVPKPNCRFLCWIDGITTPARDVVLKESELSAHKVTKTYSALFAPIALYAGATPISEIYVGTKKAKVYRGSTRIL